jgi:O-acetyl-ADP-ribose deacetylase (regulator of RNase III)
MNQQERRRFLIEALLQEQPQYRSIQIPTNAQEQRDLLRSLMNVRMPKPADETFLKIQDAYLREETARKGITDLEALTPIQDGLYLWQGDITTLRCDGIVNAANSQLLGCFCPCHGCIDNAIHTYAGVQLRMACAELMERQGHEEETGQAKLTPAYNLPCKFVLHTVGPIIGRSVTRKDEKLLASCYRSCLTLAVRHGLKSLAFCCISTGEFHFPNQRAAEIAVETVQEFRAEPGNHIEVIFNVFKETDYQIYRSILG